ncbi:MAG: hypothetical protein KF832_23680 [Caldilineaceae bacterium]|nr:hypothetical protein [Caldilineaceae bacterium]
MLWRLGVSAKKSLLMLYRGQWSPLAAYWRGLYQGGRANLTAPPASHGEL